jgi:hypothetical protein
MDTPSTKVLCAIRGTRPHMSGFPSDRAGPRWRKVPQGRLSGEIGDLVSVLPAETVAIIPFNEYAGL